MLKGIHVYRQRHIFNGDDLIGKYDQATKTATLTRAGEGKLVKSFYLRNFGLIIRIIEPPERLELDGHIDVRNDGDKCHGHPGVTWCEACGTTQGHPDWKRGCAAHGAILEHEGCKILYRAG